MKSLRLILESTSKILDASNWKRTGPQMGSNPGGVFKDHEGTDWYLKHSKSDDHAKNENLANHIYRHLGVPVPDHQLVTHSGGTKLGTASPMMKIKNFNPHSDEEKGMVQKHFASHAFVANWDTIGLDNDNQAHTPKGMTTMDAGGSLNYRAQGAPKGPAFGNKVSEWDSFRDPSNHQAHNVFGSMKPHDLVNSSHAVANMKNSDIHNLVHTYGPGEDSDKKILTNKLISRKKDIIGKANDIARKHNIKPLKDIDDNNINEDYDEIAAKANLAKVEHEKTDDLHCDLTNHYNFKGLKTHHGEAMKNYSDDSHGVNNYLWKKHAGKTITEYDKNQAFKDSSPKMDHLDEVLHHHKTLDKLQVYSGLKSDPRNHMDENNTLHHPGYLSTSIMPHVAEDFAEPSIKNFQESERHIAVINIPKDHPGTYIGDHSYNPLEREFLLPRGTNLKHTGHVETVEKNHSIYGRTKVHYHHMDVI